MKLQLAMVAACALLLTASLVQPVYPREQWLQHAPTVLALPALLLAAQRGWMSTWAMACLCALVALHVVGARWIYSYVPYDRWINGLVGSGPSEWFQWERNHYDRFMHLAFGILLTLPIYQATRRYGRLSMAWSLLAAFGLVITASAVYEIFEWMLAMIAAPQFADRYNGQQGDVWDAQKDMALALLGSLLAIGAIVVRRRLRKGRTLSSFLARWLRPIAPPAAHGDERKDPGP